MYGVTEWFEETDRVFPEDQIVYQHVKTIPEDMLTDGEMQSRLPLSKIEWKSLIKTGLVPCWRLRCSENIFYREKEVKHWLAVNYLEHTEGTLFERTIRVQVSAANISEPPPTSISSIRQLRQLPAHDYHAGVYFLCQEDEVIYVGQSLTPAVRIAKHTEDQEKVFDRVYILHCPPWELLKLELEFIRALKPRHNVHGLKMGERYQPECSPMGATKETAQ